MARWAPPLDVSAKKRIDQICLRFEAAWRAGGHPPIEPYLAGVPEPERSALLQELLLLDVDYRLRGGQTPRSDEYRTAFPEQRDIVEDVFRQSEPASAARPAGARCFGDYELLEEIARGGMGVVYRARQISLDRIVALKMILAGTLASNAEVERFHREAEAAAGLQHPNIIAIHEVGRHEGQHYFTMDFVAGKNLAQWIRETPLPIRRAAECLRTLALAIDYAHQQKTVHRDLKPSNILIDESGRLRITDFGLAKRVPADPDLTGSGQVLGTPGYMPPEQAAGKLAEIGPASDIYALGAILYKMIADRPPFCAESAAEALLQVLHVEPASPRLLNPQVPVDLETICLKCLEKAPSARYPTAAALADDLGRFLGGEPIRARPAGWFRRGGKWCRRNPAVAALTAGLMLTLALLAGSSIAAAWHLRSQRDAALAAHARAEQAERNATDKLWEAYLAHARAARRSGLAGQRFQSLQALSAAAAIRFSPELRDEAIACLALLDTRPVREWKFEGECVAFDPQLERYAQDAAGGAVHVRAAPDSRRLLALPSPGDCKLEGIRFSPCGRLLAAAYIWKDRTPPRECRVWDLEKQKVILAAPLVESIAATAFSPDGRLLAVIAPERQVRVYELTGGEPWPPIDAPTDPNAPTFQPQGRLLTLCRLGQPDVQILDVPSRRIVRTLPHPLGVFSVGWHPDGKLLAVPCADFQVYLWNVETGRLQTTLRGHQAEVVGAVFNHRGDLLATRSWDHTVRFWNHARGQQLQQMPEEAKELWFSPDDRRLAIRGPRQAGIWEVGGNLEQRTLHEPPGPGISPFSLRFTRDGQLLVSAGHDGVRFWDVRSGCERAFLPLGVTLRAELCPDDRGLITSGDSGLQHWPVRYDAAHGRWSVGPPQVSVSRPPDRPAEISLSADGKFLATIPEVDRAAVNSLEHLWERVVLGSHPGVDNVALAPDARWAATGTWSSPGLRVWDARQGTLIRDLLPDTLRSLAVFSPDGRWLVSSTDADYQCWETGTWRPVHRIGQPYVDLRGSAAFSPDNRVLALVYGRSLIQLWNPATGQRLGTLETADPANITSLCFSPDGSQLAAGGNRTIQLWDLRQVRRQLATLGLDWDLPPFRPSDPIAPPLPVTVDVALR